MAVAWRRTLALAAVGLLAVSLVGLGAYLALRGEPKPVVEPSALVPGDAVLYAEVGPLRRLAERIDAIGAAVDSAAWEGARKRFWADAEKDLGVAELAALEREWGIDLDRPAAVAVLAWTSAEEGEPEVLLLLPLEAQAVFLDRQAKRVGGAKTEEHEGRTVHVAETQAWTVLGGYAVVSSGPGPVRAAIDVDAGRRGAIRDEPIQAGGRPAGDLSVWVRGAPLAEGFRSALDQFGLFILMMGRQGEAIREAAEWLAGALDRLEGLGLAVDLDAEAPRVKVRAAFDPEWPLLAAVAGPPSSFPLLGRVPAAPYVGASAVDVGPFLREIEPILLGLLEATADTAGPPPETAAVSDFLRLTAEAMAPENVQAAEVRLGMEALLAGNVEFVSYAAGRVRDTAAAERLMDPATLAAASRAFLTFQPGARVAARGLRPLEVGGVEARGVALEMTFPPIASKEDAAALPPEMRDRMTRPMRQTQWTRWAIVGDLLLTAAATTEAAADSAVRTLLAGPEPSADRSVSLASLRGRLPAEGHAFAYVDPARIVGFDAEAPLACLARKAGEGVVEGECVWPTAHVAAFAEAVRDLARLGEEAMGAVYLPPDDGAAEEGAGE